MRALIDLGGKRIYGGADGIIVTPFQFYAYRNCSSVFQQVQYFKFFSYNYCLPLSLVALALEQVIGRLKFLFCLFYFLISLKKTYKTFFSRLIPDTFPTNISRYISVSAIYLSMVTYVQLLLNFHSRVTVHLCVVKYRRKGNTKIPWLTHRFNRTSMLKQ